MRLFFALLAVACLSAAVFASGQGQRGDATKVLAAAREALGGDQKLSAVKTFVATGRTRQISGNNLVPMEFEIACELPDKYVRRDEVPARESEPTSAGFNGEALIQVPPPAEPPAGAKPATMPAANAANMPVANPANAGAPAAAKPPSPPPDPRKARVTSLKQDFVKLTLGMFAASFSGYPVVFTLDGQAEAPQGKADIIDVKGDGNFTCRFFVSEETHLPIMVSWTTPATNVVLVVPGSPPPENVSPGSVKVSVPAPPPPTATPEEKDTYAKGVQELRKKAMATPIENRIYYGDYRDVGNGVKFPFRLRRAIGGETVEETNVDTFKINGRIDPRKFEVVK